MWCSSGGGKGDPLPGRIGTLLRISNQLARIKANRAMQLQNAVVANVQYQVELLKSTSVMLEQLIQEGKLKLWVVTISILGSNYRY